MSQDAKTLWLVSVTAEASPLDVSSSNAHITDGSHRRQSSLPYSAVVAGNPSMEVDEQAAPPSDQPDAHHATNGVQGSDLKAQEGVGRCYYTQLPRLVKVRPALHSLPGSDCKACQQDHMHCVNQSA